ncbi:hypothetical protein [Gordonia sp. UBA7599]|uniref:hypothetical protein n=1 Tax=Gordonia sp. UBA7599 TaxID=1946578 RepID=UPI0025BC2B9D|nr:hypothetical protein [Gordonia sp. UBA7599]
MPTGASDTTIIIWLPGTDGATLRAGACAAWTGLAAAAIGPDAPLRLERLAAGYRLQLALGAELAEFEDASAEGCYALGLLAVLAG